MSATTPIMIAVVREEITWSEEEGCDEPDRVSGWVDPENPWGSLLSNDRDELEFSTYRQAARFLANFSGAVWQRSECEPEQNCRTGAYLTITAFVCKSHEFEVYAALDLIEAEAEAKYLGHDAALAAASGVLMSEGDATTFLTGCDPELLDRLAAPNLSGEWAGDPTPTSLAREILGTDDPEPEAIEAICDAWTDGAETGWDDALAAVALRVLGKLDAAMQLERRNEARADRLRRATL